MSVSNSLSGRHWELNQVSAVGDPTDIVQFGMGHHVSANGCFRHQLLLQSPYLVLTKSLRLDIQCQRAASVKIGWKYLDD